MNYDQQWDHGQPSMESPRCPRTLTELHGAEGSLGCKAVVYCAHEPQQSAAYTGPEALEATAEVIRRAVGPSGPNDQQLGMPWPWVKITKLSHGSEPFQQLKLHQLLNANQTAWDFPLGS